MSEPKYSVVGNDHAFLDLSKPTATLFADNDMQGIRLLAQVDLPHIQKIDPQHGPSIAIGQPAEGKAARLTQLLQGLANIDAVL